MVTPSPYIPDTKVEIAFNAGYTTPDASRVWTDVTSYVEPDQPISGRNGRQDERSNADANERRLVLDNSDGRFTSGRAASPYFPNVKIGRPIRVTTTTNGNPVTNSRFETDTATWGIIGGGSISSVNTQFYEGARSMQITWPNAAALAVSVFCSVSGLEVGKTYTFSAYVRTPAAPRVALKLGAAFSTNSTLTAGWQRLTLVFTATATSHDIEVKNADATTAGQTSHVDAVMVNAGNAALDFTAAAPVTSIRFLGYIDDWPLEWDGTDNYATASIAAHSRLTRLGNDRQLASIVEEEILLRDPIVYYTMGEAEGAAFASDSSGDSGPAARQIGTGAAVVWGSATGPGTDDLTAATIAGGKTLRTESIPTLENRDSTLLVAFNVTSLPPTTRATIFEAHFGASGMAVIVNLDGTVSIGGFRYVGAPPYPFNGATVPISLGQTYVAAFTVSASGADTESYLDGVNVGSDGWLTSLAATGAVLSMGSRPVAVTAGDEPFHGVVAHAAVFGTALTAADIEAISEAMLTGFEDETPGDRVARYASYAGVPDAEVSAETGTSPMAHVDTTGSTALDMLRVVEETDGGVLFDAADNELTFHGRAHRYTATEAFSLSVSAQQVEAGFSPRVDRTALLNDVTAETKDGTVLAHAVNKASRDEYGYHTASLSLATTDEDEPNQAAWWRVNTYAEPRPRAPELAVDLLALPVELQNQILQAGVGSLIGATALPSQAADTTPQFFIEGWQETIGWGTDGPKFELTFNVSPAEPYLEVWTVEDPVLGQYDAYGLAY
jgi:hypothetical protein